MQIRKMGSVTCAKTMAEIIDEAVHVLSDALIKNAKDDGEEMTVDESLQIVEDYLNGEAEDMDRLHGGFQAAIKYVVSKQLVDAVRFDKGSQMIDGMDAIVSNPTVISAIVIESTKSEDGFDVGLMWKVDYVTPHFEAETESLGKQFISNAFPLIELSIIRWDDDGNIVPVKTIVTSEVSESLLIPIMRAGRIGIKYKINI